ncbi:Type I Iterative PKS [Amphichorda felina]
MSCRVAGGNHNPDQLWEYLLAKKDASRPLPNGRWEPYRRKYRHNTAALDTIPSAGHYLDDLAAFDAQFLGITQMEAEQMDPQQRISLEIAWEALENAGIAPGDLSKSDTAVFWGVCAAEYGKLLWEDLPGIEAWMGVGTDHCGVPNRISYHLDLMGPSCSVDGACASSLIAIHHGVQAIRGGESKLAIVGGVNALCGPGHFSSLNMAGALSPDGRCLSFDDSAQGYGRGEGAGCVILKSTAQAIHDGDEILAVIKGTAAAHNGKTRGIMAPSADSQTLVGRRALEVAGVDPLSVGYVEAHATSTPLGDPTEITALSRVYGTEAGRRAEEPCYIGSIKPNIGHLEAGAGIIGVIKAVLALQKGVLPGQANLNKLTKSIDWDTCGLKVVQETTKWAARGIDKVRRAAVCSYGYGGAVSHAILEEYPQPVRQMDGEHPGPYALLLSATQEVRLPAQARALHDWMEAKVSKEGLGGIASTLALGRQHHNFRGTLVVGNYQEALRALKEVAEGETEIQPPAAWTKSRVLGPETNRGIVWVFSGHGAQWRDMGKDLLQNSHFLAAVEPLEQVINSEIGVSPVGLLLSGAFESSDHVQILTYVMQIGISAVLNSYGIFPEAIIGHSVGEIAASVIAGALSPEEGAIIVSRRSVLYRQVRGQGGMILVGKSYEDVTKDLLELGEPDIVAAINSSPSSCVVSGPSQALGRVAERYKANSIKVFTVKTDIAFHSPVLEKLKDPLLRALEGKLSPTPPSRAKLYSTSLEDPRGQDLRDSAYWVNNMVNPVQLTHAVQAAVEDSYRVFMEISSHPIISHSISETLVGQEVDEDNGCMIPTLIRGQSPDSSVLHTMSQLHCRGVPINWKLIMPSPRARGLPNTMYNTTLDMTNKPFPGNHDLQGTTIVPTACLLNTFFKGTGANMLENITFRVPVSIHRSRPESIQVIVQPTEVKLLSRQIAEDEDHVDNTEDSSWVTHTTARYLTQTLEPEGRVDIPAIIERIDTVLPDTFCVDYFTALDTPEMGFPWAVREHHGNHREMLARVDTAPHLSTDAPLPWDRDSWAPVLDVAMTVGSTIIEKLQIRMPSHIEKVEILGDKPPRDSWLYIQRISGASVHVTIIDPEGTIVAKITAIHFEEFEGASGNSRSMDTLVHQVAWLPAEPSKHPLAFTSLIIISDDTDLAAEYAHTVCEDISTVILPSAKGLAPDSLRVPLTRETAIVYLPRHVQDMRDIPETSKSFAWELLEIFQTVVRRRLPVSVFALTLNTGEGADATALAHAPLIGLSRILSSEHPEEFRGLIDSDEIKIPLDTMRRIQGADIIRLRAATPTTARLQNLSRDQLLPPDQASRLLPRPEGTYLITGGLGALGLLVADFLVEKGARRLVIVSRRSLPPRRDWDQASPEMAPIITRIRSLEDQGATVHVLPLDISLPTAAQDLSDALDHLSLPRVLGVIHAAGTLDGQLAMDTTSDALSSMMAPKVNGGLALNQLFPPQSVDFFILFSSLGQYIGFPGQSSYASANAFLDCLAAHRRARGDCVVSFQWTTWRDTGMATHTELMMTEMESRGVTDVTVDEAFAAWVHLSKHDVDHGVVVRTVVFEDGGITPMPILRDIALRPEGRASGKEDGNATAGQEAIPQSLAELKIYLDQKIRACVSSVLHMSSPDEVDSKEALSDMGVDSVMTTRLRLQLQQALKVKVPPTVTWSHPTVSHLVGWFISKILRDDT